MDHPLAKKSCAFQSPWMMMSKKFISLISPIGTNKLFRLIAKCTVGRAQSNVGAFDGWLLINYTLIWMAGKYRAYGISSARKTC